MTAFDVGAHLDQSSRVQAVRDYYGPTDFTVFVTTPGYESHATANSPEAKLIGGAVMENKDKAARANPITYVTKDDPPFFIVHGDADPIVPINSKSVALRRAQENWRARALSHDQGRWPWPGFWRAGDRADGERLLRPRVESKPAAVELR